MNGDPLVCLLGGGLVKPLVNEAWFVNDSYGDNISQYQSGSKVPSILLSSSSSQWNRQDEL